jgi:hypothetical protein
MDEIKFQRVLSRIGIEPGVDSITFEYYRGSKEIPFSEIVSIEICKARISFLKKLGFWLNINALYLTPSRMSYIMKKLDYRKMKGLSIKLKNGKELFKNVGEIDLITTNRALDELNEILTQSRA